VVKAGARAVAWLAVLGIVGMAVLPPEHVHLGADHDDHVRPEVVHRHFAPHHQISIETHVEPPEADATYIHAAFTVPEQASLAAPDTPPFVVLPQAEVLVISTQWHQTGRDLRDHDPPWARPHALRGPPRLLA
jgi:hypothetical protein